MNQPCSKSFRINVIAELAKPGFTLVSVCEPELMSDDPWRKAFRQMICVFSELDKNQIVLKLRGARLRPASVSVFDATLLRENSNRLLNRGWNVETS